MLLMIKLFFTNGWPTYCLFTFVLVCYTFDLYVHIISLSIILLLFSSVRCFIHFPSIISNNINQRVFWLTFMHLFTDTLSSHHAVVLSLVTHFRGLHFCSAKLNSGINVGKFTLFFLLHSFLCSTPSDLPSLTTISWMRMGNCGWYMKG